MTAPRGKVLSRVTTRLSELWPRRVGVLLMLALPALFVPTSPTGFNFVWTARPGFLSVATFAVIFAIVAYSLGTVMRFAGLPSVVHAALWGAGAYGAGIVADRLGWPFFALLPFALLVPMLLALVVGVPALKTSGMSFLIITIALNEFLVLVANNWPQVTNGPAGLILTERPSVLPSIDFAGSRISRYYLILAFMYVTISLVAWLGRSTFGRRLRAIRDNEALAQSLGVNAALDKALIFTLSAGIAGLAGQLFIYHQQAVTPSRFAALPFITVFLMVVLGGQRSLAGPALGAWIVMFLPHWFEPIGLQDDNRQTLVYGLLLMVLMLTAPNGISGLLSNGWGGLRRHFGRLGETGLAQPTLVDAEVEAIPEEVTPGVPAEPSGGERVLLTVEGLKRHFGAVRAVDGVDLEVREGEILGIIGPNGSGKTTLFNTISGFHRATGGRVTWLGEDITGRSPARLAREGLVRTFQQPMIFESMTVRQSVAVATERAREQQPTPARQSLDLPTETDELLEFTGLAAVGDVPVGSLPYGHIRRLGVTIALGAQPLALLLDEPAAGLNDHESIQLQHLLHRARAAGTTIVVIDHDMSFLMPLVERVIALEIGRKIAEGTPQEVQSDPAVIASYLGERFAAAVEG